MQVAAPRAGSAALRRGPGPTAGDLDAKVRELGDLRRRQVELEAEIRDTARALQEQAVAALRSVGAVTSKEATAGAAEKPRRKLKASPARRGERREQIVALFAKADRALTTQEVAAALGEGRDPAALARVGQALKMANKAGVVERRGRALWGRKASGSAEKHAQAVAWAKAHPDDPRAKRIIELNGAA